MSNEAPVARDRVTRNSGTLSRLGMAATCWLPPLNSLNSRRFTSTLIRSGTCRQSISRSVRLKSLISGGRNGLVWSSGSMQSLRKSEQTTGAARYCVTVYLGANTLPFTKDSATRVPISPEPSHRACAVGATTIRNKWLPFCAFTTARVATAAITIGLLTGMSVDQTPCFLPEAPVIGAR